VTGQAVNIPSGVDIRFTGTLAFASGAVSHFHCGMDLPDLSFLEAIGSEGSIQMQDPIRGRKPGLRLQRGEEVEDIAIEPEDSYRLELENLGRAIRGEADPLLGRRDAVRQAYAIEALYRSAESGEAVDVPAGDE
jgi:predicted dehydrogenase